VVNHQLWVERGPSEFIGHRPTFYLLSHAINYERNENDSEDGDLK